jgi:predicted RNA binding protein YcfA (HicA-like mRNA interferase family)
MTPRLPTVSAEKILKILRAHGFEVARQSGSHVVLRHPDGRRVTVPVHHSRDLGRGLLRRIMKDANLTRHDIAKG